MVCYTYDGRCLPMDAIASTPRAIPAMGDDAGRDYNRISAAIRAPTMAAATMQNMMAAHPT